MKGLKNSFIKYFSIFLSCLVFFFNSFSIIANAASVEIKLSEETTEVSANKNIVTDPQIINLEAPKAGMPLDTVAQVKTKEGFFWDIPVIWLDESGEIATQCISGKKYTPIFAFYIPDTVTFGAISENSTLKLVLPDFLNEIYGDGGFISIVNASNKIAYITTTSIMDYVTSAASSPKLSSDAFSRLTVVASAAEIYNYESFAQKMEEIIRAEGNSESHETGSSDTADSTNASEEPQAPAKPVVDIIALHCNADVINNIGRTNLSGLLDLIMNVVQPQVVSQLTSSFPAYSEAATNGELGKEIGLYIYDSRFQEDKTRNLKSALAYVSAGYNNGVYEYYMGINTETLYKVSADGEYVFNENELNNLYNTVTHEMMHAIMDDYVRTGMAGAVYEGNPYYDNSDENAFPNWFIEGSATTVEAAYTYWADIFDAMRTNLQTNEKSSTFSNELLLDYYQNYNNQYYGKASINNTDKNYSDEKNTASAYVSGYLACLYLSKLAIESGKVEGYNSIIYDYEDQDGCYYDSETIRYGFSSILDLLHNGTSMDSVIYDISGGRYADTIAFQDAFLTSTDTASVDFCVDYLNYMKAVSDYLTGGGNSDAEGGVRANGSLLLPFDTALRSAIKDEVPADQPEQTLYNFVDSDTYVASTVSDEIALKSAGKHTTATGTENGENSIDQLAAKEAPNAKEAATAIEAVESDKTATFEDVPEAEETTPAEETTEIGETAKAENISQSEDTSKSEDASTPEDASKPEDTSNPEDTSKPEDHTDTSAGEDAATPNQTIDSVQTATPDVAINPTETAGPSNESTETIKETAPPSDENKEAEILSPDDDNDESSD